MVVIGRVVVAVCLACLPGPAASVIVIEFKPSRTPISSPPVSTRPNACSHTFSICSAACCVILTLTLDRSCSRSRTFSALRRAGAAGSASSSHAGLIGATELAAVRAGGRGVDERASADKSTPAACTRAR